MSVSPWTRDSFAVLQLGLGALQCREQGECSPAQPSPALTQGPWSWGLSWILLGSASCPGLSPPRPRCQGLPQLLYPALGCDSRLDPHSNPCRSTGLSWELSSCTITFLTAGHCRSIRQEPGEGCPEQSALLLFL